MRVKEQTRSDIEPIRIQNCSYEWVIHNQSWVNVFMNHLAISSECCHWSTDDNKADLIRKSLCPQSSIGLQILVNVLVLKDSKYVKKKLNYTALQLIRVMVMWNDFNRVFV